MFFTISLLLDDWQPAAKPRGHGNYLPALDKAEALLAADKDNDTCALLLLFLSDGKPSDRHIKGEDNVAVRINNRTREFAQTFGQRLTMGTIGFSNGNEEFVQLRSMAQAAKEGGATSLFKHAASAGTLSSTITSLVSTLTATEMQISCIGAGPRIARTVRPGLTPEKRQDTFTGEGWDVHDTHVQRLQLVQGNWIEANFQHPRTRGIAIRSKHFGEGAERIVYELRELILTEPQKHDRISYTPTITKMVAKAHKHTEDAGARQDFHKTFYLTQLKSKKMAEIFNHKLKPLLQLRHIPTSKIGIVNSG